MTTIPAACASFAAIAVALFGCAAPTSPQAQTAPSQTALYEQRVEEGFGRLDRLPSNWTMLPR